MMPALALAVDHRLPKASPPDDEAVDLATGLEPVKEEDGDNVGWAPGLARGSEEVLDAAGMEVK